MKTKQRVYCVTRETVRRTKAQILEVYAQGNAEAALQFAKESEEAELAELLSRFVASQQAGRASSDRAGAIGSLQQALRLDETLSPDNGKYGPALRLELSSAYFLAGLEFQTSGDVDRARASFLAAVKYDPGNLRANQQLTLITQAAPKSEPPPPPPLPQTDVGLKTETWGPPQAAPASEPAVSRTPSPTSECEAGKEIGLDTMGRCCWPGQAWNGESCVGLPLRCPAGLLVDEGEQACTLPACGAGQVRMLDGQHCCWPGQAWSASKNVCMGKPQCPVGWQGSGSTCAPEKEPSVTSSPEEESKTRLWLRSGLLALGAGIGSLLLRGS